MDRKPQTYFDDDVLEVLEVVALVVDDDVVLFSVSECAVRWTVERRLTLMTM